MACSPASRHRAPGTHLHLVALPVSRPLLEDLVTSCGLPALLPLHLHVGTTGHPRKLGRVTRDRPGAGSSCSLHRAWCGDPRPPARRGWSVLLAAGALSSSRPLLSKSGHGSSGASATHRERRCRAASDGFEESVWPQGDMRLAAAVSREDLRCARHCAKYFSCTDSLNPRPLLHR